MQLRTYRPSDCRKVYNTVHTINAKDYSLEQLNAWAPKDFDERQWDMSFRKHYTIVAEDNNEIIGFGDIDRNGYLDRLYVHALHQGEGVAAAICDLLEEYVERAYNDRILYYGTTFFENRGYRVVKQQIVERRGVQLTNYLMEKR